MDTYEAIAKQLEAGSLAPEPAVLTGARIGYARVSTAGQLLDRQTRALTDAGCLRVFADTGSGRSADRPELAACLAYLRPGDTLVVPSLDRLSRSLSDLIGLVGELRRREVGFSSLHEPWTPPPPAAGWSSTSLPPWPSSSASSSWRAPTRAWDAARARGVRLGRPPALTPEQVRHARDRCDPGGQGLGAAVADRERFAPLDGQHMRDVPFFQPAAQPPITAVDLVPGYPAHRCPGVQQPGQHPAGQLRLGRELHAVGDARHSTPVTVAGPALGHVQLPVDQGMPRAAA